MSGRALRWLLSHAPGVATVRRGRATLTIVRHHRIYADGERRLYHLGVSESMFAGQIEACARAGLMPVTVREGLERLHGGAKDPIVAFTFDDGYADNVERALPVMRRLGARGTFYLTAGLMEDRRAPWWDVLAHALECGRAPNARVTFGGTAVEIERASAAGRRAALAALLPLLRVPPAEQRARLDALRAALDVAGDAPCELAEWPLAARLAEAGMELGAHTLTHPFLTTLEPAAQQAEIAGSAALIRERLGAEVVGLAYPNGDHDARTIEATRASGLAYAVTTRTGDCDADSPALALPRRALTEGACTGPGGRFSAAMAMAELNGRFDALRAKRVEVAS